MFPLSAAEDAARLPVAVLSGFLGSGKTTLLNQLLQDPRMADTAVAINEFGAVPLDQHLIDHGADKTVVMANGCLCCNLSGDVEDAVMRIFTRRQDGTIPRFARLIVEPSGLADPAPLAEAILRQPALARALRLDGIVTVVEANLGPKQLAEHREAERQAALADVLVISKGDLADPAPVKAALRSLNPAAPLVEARHGAVDPTLLFTRAFLHPTALVSPVAEWLLRQETAAHSHGHHHNHAAASVSLLADAPLHWPAFERWLRAVRLAPDEALLRVKGILAVAGRPRPVVVQGVRHVLHPPAELPDWPSADRRSRLVLIGRGGTEGPDAWAAALQRSWQDTLPTLTESIPA